MNAKELKGTWNEFKDKLRQKFASLTDEDFMHEEGKIEETFEQLQVKLGKTKEEFQKLVSEL